MIKIEFVFFDWDNGIEYHRETTCFKSYNEVFPYGEKLADQLISENNLDYIHWNYEVRGLE